MPQLAFLQALVIAALTSFVLVAIAFPIAAKAGWRAGWLLVRLSLGVLVASVIGTVAWGAARGELAEFWATLGPGAALQMGMFFAIMYSTGFLFVSRYIASLASEATGKGDADA